MNPTTDTCPATDQSFPQFPNAVTPGDNERLRQTLRRCPPATYEAARKFQATGDTREIPTIVLGIIERFTESGLRPKLQGAHDNLILTEDLGLDSLTLMELVIIVEDVLSITIANDELQTLRSIGDVKHFITTKVGEQNRQNQRSA